MEKGVPEVLQNLQQKLKTATEEVDRLSRVITGLQEIYQANAKEERRAARLAAPANAPSSPPPAKNSGKKLDGEIVRRIELQLIGGGSPAQIAKDLGVKPGRVYAIKYRLQEEKRLK